MHHPTDRIEHAFIVEDEKQLNGSTIKDGNVLVNNTLNIFYLRLYGIGHMEKDHSDSKR